MTKIRRLSLLLILGVVLLLGLPSTAIFYTDWLWFKEVGYAPIFLKTINAEVAVFSATFAVSFLFVYANLRLALGAIKQPHIVVAANAGGPPLVLESRRIRSLVLAVSLGVALLIGYIASNDWLDWLSYMKAVPFGTVDPLFHRDIAFYVFQLPLYDDVRPEALMLAFVALGGCALMYLVSGNVALESRYGFALWPKLKLVPSARRHLALLAAVIFALMAWGAWLDIPRLLIAPTTTNAIFGASYANVYADLPFLKITLAALGLGCLLSIWQGVGGRGWAIPVSIGLYIAVSITGGVYSGFVQRFVVTPNELDKERPFILNNIEATRRAYALDHVEERELTGDAELSAKDIAANASTIENVRLWDHGPLLQTFAQIQEIRTYYEFKSVDNDRYMINGKYRQVMLSARELNSENLPNKSWVNEHLTYTHGYGLTLGPVNQVTTEGLPVLLIRDLPPVTPPDIPITEPSIYFGELATSYALVKTRQPEFHYPRGDDNVSSTYQGTGGVSIDSFWRRLLFAIRFGTTDILVTKQFTPDSRVLFHRQITDRVQMIAPFLQFDKDPYPVVSGGRIFWIQDAYTESANYPYSTPYGDFNYIRNSVKIVIDAYNGSIMFYLAEPTDPIALTLARVFPDLLHPLDEMPADLRKHVRYPEEIFAAQSSVFATYHMTNPAVFYNKEDQWQVPMLDAGSSPEPMLPYYTVMKLPGGTHTEFIQMLPFTPKLKDNLSAWMVARSDDGEYGHLISYQFPKQKIVYGPGQIIGRINQDQTISPEITLWDQQGSKVIWGTLLVIPIEESLLYVRPLYLQSSTGRIPELKRVVVAYQNQIVMEDTLTAGLIKIFGPSVAAALPPDRLPGTITSAVPVDTGLPNLLSAPATPAGMSLSDLAQLQDHFDRAMKAQRDGDWALYGEEIKKVGELIAKINKK